MCVSRVDLEAERGLPRTWCCTAWPAAVSGPGRSRPDGAAPAPESGPRAPSTGRRALDTEYRGKKQVYLKFYSSFGPDLVQFSSVFVHDFLNVSKNEVV